MLTTSESLLEKLKNTQDQNSWHRFVALYTPLLCGWASVLGLKSADADDLVQDVLLVALRHLPGFEYDRSRSFRAWLHQIAKNKANEFYRRRKVAGRGIGDEGLESVGVPATAEEFLMQQHDSALIVSGFQLACESFNESTQKAAYEVLINDRPPADVATELGMTVGAVYIAKSRVLAKVRELLRGLIDCE